MKIMQHQYWELGQLLRQWRSARHRSALAFYKSQNLSFSYPTYSEFERGMALPSPVQIVELAKIHSQMALPVMQIWAMVQMPTEPLKDAFRNQLLKQPSITMPGSASIDETGNDDKYSTPEFENTWLFSDKDRALLKKQPGLMDLCLNLSMVFPDEASWTELGFQNQNEFQAFLKRHLATWIKDGRIIASKSGLSLQKPHLHLPKSKESHSLRSMYFQRAAVIVAGQISYQELEQDKAYRNLLTRRLTRSQAEKWVKELKNLEHRFLADEESGSHEKTAYGLLIGLGRRVFKIED